MASHRRFASESATPATPRPRPLSILSPPLSQSARFSMLLPSQFEEIILQLEEKKEKIYHEGYVQKLEVNHGSTPRLPPESGWQEVYASLSGTVLSTWPAADLDLADTIGALSKVPPSYINLMDARIDQRNGSHYISITTAGNRQVRLRSSHGDVEIARWLLAIRLSAFERSRMQEAYTANLFLKFHTRETTSLMGGEEVWSGYVDARICGGDVAQTQWSKFWCHVVQAPKKRNSLQKRLSLGSTNVETQIQFFQEKRERAPLIVMHQVFAAYACYPEHISLIETAGVIKLEGNVHLRSSGPRQNSEGFALIIPAVPERSKRLSITSSPKPVSLVDGILRFLYAVWSAFDLYNMPAKLHLNAEHVDALGLNGSRLDIQSEQLHGKIPWDCTSDRTWKSVLRERAFASTRAADGRSHAVKSPSAASSNTNAYRRSGNERRVVSEGAIRMPAGRPLVTSIEEDEELERQTGTAARLQGASTGRPLVTSLEEDERLERLAAAKEATALPQNADTYSNLVPQVALVGSGRQVVQHNGTGDARDFANLDRPPSPYSGTGDASTYQRSSSSKRHSKGSHQSSISSLPDSTLQNLGPKVLQPKSAGTAPKRSFESPLVPQVTPPDAQEFSEHRPIASDTTGFMTNRPLIPDRVMSHDSRQSELSESSHYSAGIDLAALDMVQQYQTPVQQNDYPVERDESIYSAAADDQSDYASTIGEAQPLESTADMIRKRLSAQTALDIQRQTSIGSPNPYARPRTRLSS